MALSNAERQKRWRDKRNALATAALTGQQQLRNDTEFIERCYQGQLDWTQARIRELEQELEAARARPGVGGAIAAAKAEERQAPDFSTRHRRGRRAAVAAEWPVPFPMPRDTTGPGFNP